MTLGPFPFGEPGQQRTSDDMGAPPIVVTHDLVDRGPERYAEGLSTEGEGTVPYRFNRLMDALTQRFPDAVHPNASDPPEPKLLAAIDALTVERDHLAKFKAYVHKRLDDKGVPVDPESMHQAAGCRIGGRLDWMFEDLSARMRIIHTLNKEIEGLIAERDEAGKRAMNAELTVDSFKAENARLKEALRKIIQESGYACKDIARAALKESVDDIGAGKAGCLRWIIEAAIEMGETGASGLAIACWMQARKNEHSIALTTAAIAAVIEKKS